MIIPIQLWPKHANLLIRGLSVRRKSYNSLDYCINIVRTLDNENFLCTLLLPANLRPTAFAVRAFNVEIASVEDLVSKPQLGAMRLKFWDDCVDKIYNGKVPNNPVAVELAKAVKVHRLSKTRLKRLVSSRMGRLDQTSFNSLKDMETYAEASCGSLYLLLLEAAGIKSDEALLAGCKLGTAHGTTNLIRGIPYCLKNRKLSLPSDLLAHHDVSEESVFRGNQLEGMKYVLKDIAYSVHCNLEVAREATDLPDTAKRIFLPAVAVERYLKVLRNSGFDVFDPNTQRKNVFLPLQLYWNAFKKTF